ncbi:MAG TPA: fatty acid desaturase, partial [Marmoricola sp.]|nr:fatty acid desaturase [Marmoricola sp.]
TGNLSFQIEHHLYPDLPSNRYAEISVQVKALFDKYDLPYVTGSLPKQVYSAWRKIVRLSLPNDFMGMTNKTPAPIAMPKREAPAAA